MNLIRLILSTVFMHGLLSNPNRGGDNNAFIRDAVGITDDLLATLQPEDTSDDGSSTDGPA